MLYAIAILLPNPLSSDLYEIQKRFKYSDWKIALPPHITIAPPFSLKHEVNFSAVTTILKDTLNPFGPFQVELTEVDRFDNQVGTIYLSVKVSRKLSGIHSAINQSMFPLTGEITDYPRQFVPHVTLSGDIPKDLLEQKFAGIKDLNLEGSFVCKEITLLKKSSEDKRWVPLEQFDLK